LKRQTVTFSPSLTVTLTHDCPWRCRYCGFRTDKEGLISDTSLHQKRRRARAVGAREILLISGERPDSLPHIRHELKTRGFPSFIAFASSVARQLLEDGFLPHGNYGALSEKELERCRDHHASMGVMLENIEDLPGVAPQKRATGRLKTIEAAGRLQIPFTSGILIGVGESVESRFRSLDALADLHLRFGHLQEIIIQNFVPNPGSCLQTTPSTPEREDYERLIAYWRGLCPEVAIQIPPNLNPFWRELLPLTDDLGGISPDGDEVNPVSPWSQIETYRSAVARAGGRLKQRLSVHQPFISPEWLSPPVLSAIREQTCPVRPQTLRSTFRGQLYIWRDALWDLSTTELTEGAREYRRRRFGNQTTFVINRNANFTNICNVGCTFCGFARKRSDPDAYVRPIPEIVQTLENTPGITETCLQGGIHPDLDFSYYRDLVQSIRQALPDLHIHAFSPMELVALHRKTGRTIRDLLWELKDAGLNTIPGTAAEILVDEVRREISGNKLTAWQWEEVIRTAHGLGIRSTATIMYGHIETWDHIRTHLEKLLHIQEDTGGFTELVPLAFIPYRNRLGRRLNRMGFEAIEKKSRETARRLYPLARLFFTDSIDHLQTSWVKLGLEGALQSLEWGCDDFGGTLFEESITRESGGPHGECLAPEQIRTLLTAAGYTPVERTTLYQPVSKWDQRLQPNLSMERAMA